MIKANLNLVNFVVTSFGEPPLKQVEDPVKWLIAVSYELEMNPLDLLIESFMRKFNLTPEIVMNKNAFEYLNRLQPAPQEALEASIDLIDDSTQRYHALFVSAATMFSRKKLVEDLTDEDVEKFILGAILHNEGVLDT